MFLSTHFNFAFVNLVFRILKNQVNKYLQASDENSDKTKDYKKHHKRHLFIQFYNIGTKSDLSQHLFQKPECHFYRKPETQKNSWCVKKIRKLSENSETFPIKTILWLCAFMSTIFKSLWVHSRINSRLQKTWRFLLW